MYLYECLALSLELATQLVTRIAHILFVAAYAYNAHYGSLH